MRDGWAKQLRTLPFKNSSSETIPPFAAMELDYFGESGKSACELLDDTDLIFRCKKPTTAISGGRLVFNSWKPVPEGGFGEFQVDPYALALADLNPAMSPDDTCGPVSGSWYIKKTGAGLFFRSYDTGRAHYVSSTIRTVWVSISSGGDTIMATTTIFGIGPMTSTSLPFTFPSADCNRIDPETGDRYSPNQVVRIYNMVNQQIGASTLIQAKRIGSRYFVDVDNCGNNFGID